MFNNLSKTKRLILTLPLLLAAALFLPSNTVPSVRAAGFTGTGLVCVTASTTATNCSNAAPTVGPFTVGSTFSVGVFINNSQAMGGFDIYVRSDPTFLTPDSAVLGPLISSPSLTSICINGSPQTGSCTVGTANGAGVVEVTTIESTGTNECGGVAPCSGLAFTITYTVVGVPTTGTTPLSYPTAAGCATSSVSIPVNTCVLVDDSLGTTLPETIQGANISITIPTAQVCVTFPSTMPCGAVNIGPVTKGQTFTVGVRIQNSQPYAGYDIYVSDDSHYLRAISASLSTGIASPSLTTICLNGSAQNGTCTPNTVNGPDVVEVSTVESSGLNECSATPCSGLLFTITYQVLHRTPHTLVHLGPVGGLGCALSSVASPSNVCLEVLNSTGTVLPENSSDGIVAQNVFVDSTNGVVSCAPNPVVVGNPTTCTGMITDTNATNPDNPIFQVAFTTNGTGTSAFSPTPFCDLSELTGSSQSNCLVTYTPGVAGSHLIGCFYSGDTAHNGAVPCSSLNLTVLRANVTIATGVIVDQTGLPVNNTLGVPAGLSVHDVVALVGGFPVTGVSGTVTYTLFPNGVCTPGTGTVISTFAIGPSDNVMPSASVAPVAGSYSFAATYSGDTNNNAIASACEPFTIIPAPSFTAGKLHWTHHLSLSKSGNVQSWTAIVTNPLVSAAKAVIEIKGQSTTNPSLTFDVTCGVTCVNTGTGGVNHTVGLTPVAVPASTSSFSFSFGQTISSGFSGQKISFTATVYWTTGTVYTAGTSKSGSFAVVP